MKTKLVAVCECGHFQSIHEDWRPCLGEKVVFHCEHCGGTSLQTVAEAQVIFTQKAAASEKLATPCGEKPFTVVAVSTNTNSFGYRSVLCLAEDGEGFEGLVQAYGTDKVPSKGDTVRKDDPRWYAGTRALAPTLPKNAKKVLKEIKNNKN